MGYPWMVVSTTCMILNTVLSYLRPYHHVLRLDELSLDGGLYYLHSFKYRAFISPPLPPSPLPGWAAPGWWSLLLA
jgi:hypothetical protein